MSEERLALVTGAGGGIGRAIARALKAAGWQIALLDLEEASIRDSAAELDAVALTADITDEASVAQALATLTDMPDLLVNNAGIVGKGALLDQPVAAFRRILDINLVGALIMARAVVPRMMEKGRGVIVNVTSIAAVTANPNGNAYGPSKAALANLTRVMATEWAAHRIRVNAIAPGMIDGGMATAGNDPEARAARAAMVPTGALGLPDEVADVVCFLASDAARYVTGQQLLVDGGLSSALLARLPMPAAT